MLDRIGIERYAWYSYSAPCSHHFFKLWDGLLSFCFLLCFGYLIIVVSILVVLMVKFLGLFVYPALGYCFGI